jgi:hypothetical protein
MDSSNIISPSIVDKILLQADIDFLLNDLEVEEDLFDPYSLTPVVRFYESKFITEVKHLPSVSKPRRKAYKEKFISEVELIAMNGGKLSGLYLNLDPHLKVEVPGVEGDYYIERNRLKQLLKEFEAEEYTVPYGDGLALVKLLAIDKQLLLDNCEKR